MLKMIVQRSAEGVLTHRVIRILGEPRLDHEAGGLDSKVELSSSREWFKEGMGRMEIVKGTRKKDETHVFFSSFPFLLLPFFLHLPQQTINKSYYPYSTP